MALKTSKAASGLLVVDRNDNVLVILKSRPYDVHPREWSDVIRGNLASIESFFSEVRGKDGKWTFNRDLVERCCYSNMLKAFFSVDIPSHPSSSDVDTVSLPPLAQTADFVGPKREDGSWVVGGGGGGAERAIQILYPRLFPEIFMIPRGHKEKVDYESVDTALREFEEETKCSVDEIYVHKTPFPLEWEDAGTLWKYDLYVGFTEKRLTFQDNAGKAFFHAYVSCEQGDERVQIPVFVNVDSYRRASRLSISNNKGYKPPKDSFQYDWRDKSTNLPRSYAQEYSLLSNSASKRYNEIIVVMALRDYCTTMKRYVSGLYAYSNYDQLLTYITDAHAAWLRETTTANRSKTYWRFVGSKRNRTGPKRFTYIKL